MSEFTPQEVTKFKAYLREREIYISSAVQSDLPRQIVSLTFQILQTSLQQEFERASHEMEDTFKRVVLNG